VISVNLYITLVVFYFILFCSCAVLQYRKPRCTNSCCNCDCDCECDCHKICLKHFAAVMQNSAQSASARSP